MEVRRFIIKKWLQHLPASSIAGSRLCIMAPADFWIVQDRCCDHSQLWIGAERRIAPASPAALDAAAASRTGVRRSRPPMKVAAHRGTGTFSISL